MSILNDFDKSSSIGVPRNLSYPNKSCLKGNLVFVSLCVHVQSQTSYSGMHTVGTNFQ